MPRPTLKDEVETTRTPQKAPSSQRSSPKEGKWGPQEAGIEAPCLGLVLPTQCPAGGGSAPLPAGNWAPGRGAHLTGPCSRELSCETCFKPPNHKNGRFSQPCSHVSQISQGVFSISIQETPGQPPTPGGQENTVRRPGRYGNPPAFTLSSRVPPKRLQSAVGKGKAWA